MLHMVTPCVRPGGVTDGSGGRVRRGAVDGVARAVIPVSASSSGPRRPCCGAAGRRRSAVVLHRGPDAVYLDVGARASACSAPAATGRSRARCAPALDRRLARGRRAPVVVRDGVLHLDDATAACAIGRLARRPAVTATVRGLRARGALERSPPDAARPATGRPGDGLTPLGDDVLVRLAGGHRAAGVATPVVDAAVRALLAPRRPCCRRRCSPARCTARWSRSSRAVAGRARHRRRGSRWPRRWPRVGDTSGAGLLEGAHGSLAAWTGSEQA